MVFIATRVADLQSGEIALIDVAVLVHVGPGFVALRSGDHQAVGVDSHCTARAGQFPDDGDQVAGGGSLDGSLRPVMLNPVGPNDR
jgi:hypothetical protein